MLAHLMSAHFEPLPGRRIVIKIATPNIRLALVLLGFLSCFPLQARAEHKPWTLNLYFENDLFGETDQNYTNGVRLSWASPDTTSFEDDEQLPAWLRSLNHRLHFFHDDKSEQTHSLVISLGQLMYTPSDTETRAPVPNQRPYAAYLYGGIAYHTRDDRSLDTVELNLGIVGPSALGELAQDTIHELRDFDKYNGWDNQLKDEPGLLLVYEHKQRLFRRPLRGNFGHDFIAHAGVALGNVATYGNIGGEYRIGWDLPDDFGTSAVRPGGDNSAPGINGPRRRHSTKPIYGLHGFISVDARLVARDIFLDGNTYKSSLDVDKEHEVADISVGFSFLSGRWKISYATVIRTREFKQQPHHHKYGSMSLSYSF